ncbi:uncharacterized protein HKW66_Vig0037820 [Vigna angularis]|uniref:Uncharacterized protein n=1 Tax=Phaseolus angularis TaxID=3914 RepID=A0A8T0L7W3_PHAAN|nr:uncharacterized protein HKW66_Vig0037820 [Vigna angularis]
MCIKRIVYGASCTVCWDMIARGAEAVTLNRSLTVDDETHHVIKSLATARKNIRIQPPAIPRSPQHPTWYTTNEESDNPPRDAYRPTSPGHSPGVGHNEPPTQA